MRRLEVHSPRNQAALSSELLDTSQDVGVHIGHQSRKLLGIGQLQLHQVVPNGVACVGKAAGGGGSDERAARQQQEKMSTSQHGLAKKHGEGKDASGQPNSEEGAHLERRKLTALGSAVVVCLGHLFVRRRPKRGNTYWSAEPRQAFE